MRPALTYIVVWALLEAALCAPAEAAERRSWNKVRYLGGTIEMTASRYDWNAKITVSTQPDSIVLVIYPAKVFTSEQTIRIAPDHVLSLSGGPVAWQRLADIQGAHLPPKPPALFGLLQNYQLMAIVYDSGDGKRSAVLLESLFTWQILPILKKLTGKPIDD